MATILAFGDSLTYGARPDALRRHAHDDLWPTVLGQALGPAHRVIAEGMNGRTTVFASPLASGLRSGAEVLPTLLNSHAPLDLVILMLGTNDVMVSEMSARAAARGMDRVAEIVRSHPYWGGMAAPKVLLVAPPGIRPDALGETTDRDIAEIGKLARAYRRVAGLRGLAFFDAGTVTQGADPDGVHLDAAGNHALGAALAPVVTGLLGLDAP